MATRAVKTWWNKPLLHFPSNVAIELSTGHPGGLARFFAGTPTLCETSFAMMLRFTALANGPRASTIKRSSSPARGIDSVFLAVGLVSWTNGDEHFTAPMRYAQFRCIVKATTSKFS